MTEMAQHDTSEDAPDEDVESLKAADAKDLHQAVREAGEEELDRPLASLFFSGLAANFKARRPLVAFFEDNYDAVRFFLWRWIHETELTDGARALMLFL